MKALVNEAFAFNLGFTNLLVRDIADERMCEQPGGVRNHPAWNLGHMALACGNMVEMMGGATATPTGWKELFDSGTEPTGDRGRYPSKAELVRGLEASHEHLSKAFSDASEEQLAAPTPDEQFRRFFPTIGNMAVFIMLSHEATHTGQITTWRCAIGMPRVF